MTKMMNVPMKNILQKPCVVNANKAVLISLRFTMGNALQMVTIPGHPPLKVNTGN